MAFEKMVGTHKVIVDGDVVMNLFGGNPTVDDMRKIMDLCFELVADQPVFVLVDLSNVDTLGADVRRVIGESKLEYAGLGMCGVSFQMRVIAKLVNNAISLLSKKTVRQDFFKTRVEVLAWFDELRSTSGKAGA